MDVRSYRDLDVWQLSMELVVECYKGSKPFPAPEVYGLTSQLRRAAVSVPANIAAGHARQHTAEYVQHLSIAYGALAELETHLLIAGRLHYVGAEDVERLLNTTGKIGRMLNRLRRALQAKTH